MNRTTPHAAAARRAAAQARAARAFTLLEVLLGVLILALGLLGLGALIPVVVRQQRTAIDETLGVVVAGDARAFLQGRTDLNRARDIGFYSTGATATDDYRKGWGMLCLSEESGTPTPADDDDATFGWSPTFEWEPWTAAPVLFTLTSGDYTIQGAQSPDNDVTLTMTDRLWPQRGAAQPQFVWDILARRVSTPAGEAPKLQIALFVRRLDPNIRVPRGQTLYQHLAAGNAVPVGVDGNGLPSRDGSGDYAQPVILDIDFERNNPDRIELTSGSATERRLAGQIGQKLVDNLGNVYTVTKTGADASSADADVLYIQPPVPAWVVETSESSEFRFHQVGFTPQIPAAVEVFTVSPSDPEI